MLTNPLIVPTKLTTGVLHFAEVQQNATAQDVIDALVGSGDVKSEVLGDLEDQGWALQTIRAEQSGRPWKVAELEALGDGTLQPTALIAPLLAAASAKPPVEQQTSPMHQPALRLVSLNPALFISFSFLRIREIYDDFEYKLFLSRNATAKEVVGTVVEELGLTKTLFTPGGGDLEYMLEEVWTDGDTSKSSRLPNSAVISDLVGFPFSPNPCRPQRGVHSDSEHQRSGSVGLNPETFSLHSSRLRSRQS
ncbi:hypothetical protein B0H19DRAFT_941165 [Mycena capillaripes]|nr:hypothetical protein B0H19DRAFT_941165 [Mycena capillaripes]